MDNDNNEASLVASIAATSPIAFDTAFEAKSTPADSEKAPNLNEDDTNPWSGARVSEPELPADPSKDPPADPPVTPPADLPADPPADPPTDDYSDFTSAALAAQVLNEKHPGIFGEVSKDREWDSLINDVDKYITETLEAGRTHQGEQKTQATEYVDFLLGGGDPQALQAAIQYADHTGVDLETADDTALEKIIRADMKAKNVGEDANLIIESVKVKNQLKERALVAQTSLKEREGRILQAEQEQRVAQESQAKLKQEKTEKQINEAIDKDAVMGYQLDDALRQELRDMIFKPSEIIEQEVNGEKVTQRVTPFQKLRVAFDQNLEQQVAFALLLKRGFDLSAIVADGEKQKSNSLMDELRKRGGGSQTLPKVTNGYLNEE